MGNGTATTREALMVELIGDMANLLDRAEALRISIPAASDAAVEAIQAKGENIACRLEDATAALRQELQRERSSAKQDLQGLIKAVTSAADSVTDGAQRISLNALIIGAGAGALAGVLTAALVVTMFL